MFGIGYGAHGATGTDRTAATYPIFLASLVLVFGADDAFAFLFAWELMALSSACSSDPIPTRAPRAPAICIWR